MYWIPSHIRVSGNERVDSTAKSALDLSPDNISILYTDLKPQTNKVFLTKWQQRWNNSINNKLFQIKPTLGEWKPAFRKSRKEQVIISWLRIGQSSLTHSFILKQEQRPPYTIKHVLVGSGDLANTRERHFNTNNMKDVLVNVHMDDVLSFMTDTELYLKIHHFSQS